MKNKAGFWKTFWYSRKKELVNLEKCNQKVSIWITPELKEKLKFQAHEKGMELSSYARRLLEEGASVDAYKEDADFIAQIVRNEMNAIAINQQNEFSKNWNRMAAMIYKDGKATFATLVAVLALFVDMSDPELDGDLKSTLQKALALGAKRMNQKEAKVDVYLETGDALVDGEELRRHKNNLD